MRYTITYQRDSKIWVLIPSFLSHSLVFFRTPKNWNCFQLCKIGKNRPFTSPKLSHKTANIIIPNVCCFGGLSSSWSHSSSNVFELQAKVTMKPNKLSTVGLFHGLAHTFLTLLGQFFFSLCFNVYVLLSHWEKKNF